MTTHATPLDVSNWTGIDYEPEDWDRIAGHIVWAERYIARRAGWDFYDANDTTGQPSQDWIEAVCRVVSLAFLQDDPETQEHLSSPYSSERSGDYQYTISPERMADIRSNTAIEELIAYHSGMVPVPLAVMVVQGPTRNKVPQYDPDTGSWYVPLGDVSRGDREGAEITEQP